MFRIKRLDTFILQTFLPVFLMTFLICLFIVLMQFLWKYVEEMVGKGIEISVLLELFLYAALTMVPMALPLAVLLASLMTFGSLGERYELLAIKASGVSLIRIMRPLMVTIGLIAIGAFFFQDQVLPHSQVKMYSLLLSMRQKSPELDIPEGIFYKEIDGFNIYVKDKNRESGMLYDVMIYDISGNFEDAAVIVADSGKMSMTEDKHFLFLTLWSGESFENLKDQRTAASNVPYRRESFSKKEILIEFDANFNRMDESFMSNQYIGKNTTQLISSIDSLSQRTDSTNNIYSEALRSTVYFRSLSLTAKNDTALYNNEIKPYNKDSLYATLNVKQKYAVLQRAQTNAISVQQDYTFKETLQNEEQKTIRRHEIEIHKKFTLSFACLVFFFIGAPLGAIIRKGGLGVPVIISVFLFIIYYIIDNSGYKMARDGQLNAWEGIWLSSGILVPLGIFFTYKAMNDSVLFNAEIYEIFLRELFGLQKQRLFIKKEVIIETLDNQKFSNTILNLSQQSEEYLHQAEKSESINVINLFKGTHQPEGYKELVTNYNLFLEVGSNAAEYTILKQLSTYPVLYKMEFGTPFRDSKKELLFALLLPISIGYYLLALYKRKQRIKAIHDIIAKNQALLNLLK